MKALRKKFIVSSLLIAATVGSVFAYSPYDTIFKFFDGSITTEYGVARPSSSANGIPVYVASQDKISIVPFEGQGLLLCNGEGQLCLSDIGQDKVSGLEESLSNRSMVGHTHIITDIVGLAGQLASLSSSNGLASATSSGKMSSSDFLKLAALSTTTNQADWTQNSTSSPAYIKNKPSLATVATTGAYSDLTGKPTLDQAYKGTTLRTGVFPIYKSTTVGAVTSGNVVVYLTNNNTSTGTALCTNGVILDSVTVRAEEGTQPHTPGTAAISNSNRTLTIPVSKVASVLGLLTLNQSADGSTVKVGVSCY